MFRLLLTRRWLGALALAAVFFVTCVYLGRWQFGRYVERSAAVDAVVANYDAAPVPVDEVIPSGSQGLPADDTWTTVTAVGRYDPQGVLYVRNRPQNKVYGYDVLAPLQLKDGTRLLVDRGWVPNAERADILPQVPPPPTGEVTVTGWLRPGEPSLGRNIPGPQLASINLDEAAGKTPGAPLRVAYLVMKSEDDGSGTTPARPEALLPPDTTTGPHFAYALQWWMAAPVGFIIVGVYLRREYRDLTGRSGVTGGRPGATVPSRPGAVAGDQRVDLAGGSGGPRGPGASAAPAKRKRTWIWDEEDE